LFKSSYDNDNPSAFPTRPQEQEAISLIINPAVVTEQYDSYQQKFCLAEAGIHFHEGSHSIVESILKICQSSHSNTKPSISSIAQDHQVICLILNPHHYD